MKKVVNHNVLINEIKLIPENNLPELYEYIHHFRKQLEIKKCCIDSIMEFAGSWEDMPDDVFNDFLEETEHRRKQAFI